MSMFNDFLGSSFTKSTGKEQPAAKDADTTESLTDIGSTLTDALKEMTETTKTVPADAALEGIFTIYTAMPGQPAMCLDVNGASKSANATVILYQENKQKNQQFKFTLVDQKNLYYKIEAVHSGLVLDVKGGVCKSGDIIMQYHYHGGDNQLWKLEKLSNGNYIIICKKNSLVLDVSGGRRQNCTQIIAYTRHGNENQQFLIIPVK